MRAFERRHDQRKSSPPRVLRCNTAARGPDHRHDPILRLQRTIGNQAVLRMLQKPATPTPRTITASERFGDGPPRKAEPLANRVTRISRRRIQRACGKVPIEGALSAAHGMLVDLGDPGAAGTLIRFRVGCDEFLAAKDEAALRELAARLPWRTRIVIHGFASEEGSSEFNLLLSMARAWKVRDILAGLVDTGQIADVVAHGGVPGSRPDSAFGDHPHREATPSGHQDADDRELDQRRRSSVLQPPWLGGGATRFGRAARHLHGAEVHREYFAAGVSAAVGSFRVYRFEAIPRRVELRPYVPAVGESARRTCGTANPWIHGPIVVRTDPAVRLRPGRGQPAESRDCRHDR